MRIYGDYYSVPVAVTTVVTGVLAATLDKIWIDQSLKAKRFFCASLLFLAPFPSLEMT
jgi:hypothetical protein